MYFHKTFFFGEDKFTKIELGKLIQLKISNQFVA